MAGEDDRGPLPPGLYEEVVDRGVDRRIRELASRGCYADVEPLDEGDSHAVLADHIRQLAREALDGLTGEDRVERQARLCDDLIRLLPEGFEPERRLLVHPARRLLGVWPDGPEGPGKPERPDTPLALGCLLAGTRLDPSLVSQLRKELASADRVDILCSFIKWSGLRILEEDLRAFAARPGARLRVLTTSYMGATDLKAVDLLHALPNAEVRVSYDTHRTRLHAKAYLFHRDTGFSTAYVGSANLSRPALTEGLEWTVKVSRYESPHLWDRIAATFETYWEDGEFVPYGPSERPRLKAALEQERGVSDEATGEVFPFELRPYAFQQEILDRLDAERRSAGTRSPPRGRRHRHRQDAHRRLRLPAVVPAAHRRLGPARSATTPVRRPSRGGAAAEPAGIPGCAPRPELRRPARRRPPARAARPSVRLGPELQQPGAPRPARRPLRLRRRRRVPPRGCPELRAAPGPRPSEGSARADRHARAGRRARRPAILRRPPQRPDPPARRDQPQAAGAVPILRRDRHRGLSTACAGRGAATGPRTSTESTPATTSAPPW